MKQCHICGKVLETSLEEFGENVFEPVCQSCYLSGLEEIYTFDSRQEFEMKSAEAIAGLDIGQQDINKISCPECGAKMILKKTNKFTYADKSPRYFYGCSNYPKCKATHGANPDGSPLGIPANDETKKYRILAHNAFDPIWKNKKMKRREAYKWLTEQLGMEIQAHIGSMNIKECEKVIKICSEFEERRK